MAMTDRNASSMTEEELQSAETIRLIGSDKVEGTNVYNHAGDHLGHIDRVMIDKRSGKVSYAVMSFGGFLGIGEEHYPLPWDMLTYDVDRDGYVVDLSREKLEGAPSFGRGSDPDWDTRPITARSTGITGSPTRTRWSEARTGRCPQRGGVLPTLPRFSP